MSNKDNITLKKIFLSSSEFKRPVDYISKEAKMEINISKEIEDGKLIIFLNVKAKMGEDCSITVTMAGIFEYTNNPIIPIEYFAKVNGPAILYPFVREHIASISTKANIGQILLPPINFVEMAQKE